ncbi:MAG: CRISPR system precrRNA processing endoribonuclease RAMP protein Cas6 [Methanobacteriota archaeon]|nr:MAG: CRISPR system precrRNA processing endoribonuclease RAMP protein Cas6 [Euryarchaeota archaeon]
MIISELKVHLQSLKDQEMPYNYGYDLMESINLLAKDVSSPIANEIGLENEKYSISRVQIDDPDEDHPYRLNAGETANFRIFTTDPILMEQFDHLFSNGKNFDLFGLNFEIEDLSFRTIDLKNRPLLSNPIQLFFVTPSSFMRENIEIPFPSTDILFESLLHVWNIWFPAFSLDEHIIRENLPLISIKYAKGTVNRIPFVEGQFIHGWRGMIKLEVQETENLREICELIRLGSLSGVGRGRTLGFGRYRIIFERRPSSGD